MPSTIYSVDDRRALPTRDLPPTAILYGEDAPYTVLYNSYGVGERIAKDRIKQYLDKGYSDVLPTIAVTGTAIAGGVTEAEIVTGGETLIFTLTNGTWHTDVVAQLAASYDYADFLFGDGGSGAGALNTNLNNDGDIATDVVRTSATVLTITLPALGSYSIAADERGYFRMVSGQVLYPNGTVILWNPDGDHDERINGSLQFSPTRFTITAS